MVMMLIVQCSWFCYIFPIVRFVLNTVESHYSGPTINGNPPVTETIVESLEIFL